MSTVYVYVYFIILLVEIGEEVTARKRLGNFENCSWRSRLGRFAILQA